MREHHQFALTPKSCRNTADTLTPERSELQFSQSSWMRQSNGRFSARPCAFHPKAETGRPFEAQGKPHSKIRYNNFALKADHYFHHPEA